MQYVLRELFDDLKITLTELSRRSGISDVTLISIRNGKSARRSTINTLLYTFSEIYGVKLTLKNVEGIIIQGKPVSVSPAATQQEAGLPVSSVTRNDHTRREVPQNRIVEPKKRASTKQKEKKPTLPDGCILATDFANLHGVDPRTFRDHMNIGLGPGLIHGDDVSEDGSVQVKDYVHSQERNKRVRKNGTVERERYLTQEQQHTALAFWKRHDVAYVECNDIGCWCHTVKNGGV